MKKVYTAATQVLTGSLCHCEELFEVLHYLAASELDLNLPALSAHTGLNLCEILYKPISCLRLKLMLRPPEFTPVRSTNGRCWLIKRINASHRPISNALISDSDPIELASGLDI